MGFLWDDSVRSSPILVVIVIILALIIWIWMSFNRFIQLRTLVRNAWSNTETELKRRYDLIPNLVSVVKEYAAHEQAVFEAVTAARTAAIATNGAPVEVQAPAEQALVTNLRTLLATAEAYPELEAATNFLELQQELVMTEDRIQLARRVYNANVLAMNNRVDSFPSNLVASMFDFQREDFFEIDEASIAAPIVDI